MHVRKNLAHNMYKHKVGMILGYILQGVTLRSALQLSYTAYNRQVVIGHHWLTYAHET